MPTRTARWMQRFRRPPSPEILSLVSDAEMLPPRLREAQQAADLVLIDLEGSANQAMLYAAGKSDLVIIPAQPSAYDVRGRREKLLRWFSRRPI